MNAVEVRRLSKSYPGFSLENVNLTLPSGCIMGLVGENGAGKSTLIKLIMNAIPRENGSVKVLGVDNTAPEFGKGKEDIGVVLDEAYYPEILTPKNVGAVMKNTYKNWDDAQYQKYLRQFELPETKPFKDFSRGMKMKLATAAALSHKPKLLVLDEATSGLDPMVREEMLDIFNEFTRDEGHSILISSHIVSDLEKICDYIAFIHSGKLLFCEEKDRLLEEYAVVKMSRAEFEAVPPEAVRGFKDSGYGVEALVYKPLISSVFVTEHTTLEDIILFLAKGGDRK